MKNLQKYYGKKLVYIVTKLKKGVINTDAKEVEVYNPKDFKNGRREWLDRYRY